MSTSTFGKASRPRSGNAEGRAFADYNEQGELLGVELLGPCKVTVLDQIARKEPKPVMQFLRGSIPREMALVSNVARPAANDGQHCSRPAYVSLSF